MSRGMSFSILDKDRTRMQDSGLGGFWNPCPDSLFVIILKYLAYVVHMKWFWCFYAITIPIAQDPSWIHIHT